MTTNEVPATVAQRPSVIDRSVRWALVVANGTVAVTALAGGVALALGLEDDNLGVDLLAGTPFRTFLWPGIALTSVVGGSATVATVSTLRRHPWAGRASIVAGAVLAGWIGIEIALLDQPDAPSTTEVVYLGAAAAMIGLGAVRSVRGRSSHDRA